MRYEKGHKEETHRKIVATAAARFRKDGIESVGVADLMAEAGLTHGGFYSHFRSKEDLVRAAMEEASCHSVNNFACRIEEGGLERWIRSYLRIAHRDHPEKGCAAAALASELARLPKTSRTVFSESLERMTTSIASHLPATLTPAGKRKTAIAIFSTLVGALQLARAVVDPAHSEEILEAGIASALDLAGISSSRQ